MKDGLQLTSVKVCSHCRMATILKTASLLEDSLGKQVFLKKAAAAI